MDQTNDQIVEAGYKKTTPEKDPDPASEKEGPFTLNFKQTVQPRHLKEQLNLNETQGSI